MRHRPLLAGALAALCLVAAGTTAAPAADVPGPVTGRVVGPDGQPRAGVVVRMTAYGERVAAAETTTASDGTFTLPGTERPARFVLVVCSSDEACDDVWQATELVKTYVGPDEQAFTLPRLHGYFTTDLTGETASPAVDVGDVDVVRPATLTVRDETGHWVPPFSGPAVSELWPEIHQDVTVFPVLAPGTHDVRLDWLDRSVTVTAGESTELRFGPRPLITGRILVGGRPVRGEHVAVVTSTVHRLHGTVTDRTGRYRTGPLPIGRRLTVRLGADSGGTLYPDNRPKGLYHLTVQAGEVRNLSLAVPSGSRGAVEATGDLDSTIVGLRPVSGPWLGRLFAPDGRTRTGGLTPGRYVLTASWRTQNLPGVQDWRADREVVRVRADHTVRAHLAPRTGPGEVTLHADPGSYVRLDSASPDATFSTREVPASGEVAISGLPVGDYDVTVARDQYATPSAPVRVRVGSEPAEATLPAPPALGSARVRLVDPDTGQPWPWTAGVITAVSCPGGQLTLEDGVFVGELEPGTYRDCTTWELWNDANVPTGTTSWGRHALDGTLVVRPGEMTTADLAVDLTP
ncbi:carboxypeptidase-like regulatory domain-containing protein [Nocardioides sp.]|uniref:carboxypeptidase-like regulatory domain-containing protein n=1 Tax=Nocardioides sp. TaxID=35761 RepID=UPI0025DF0518|nr:carboxypeptidase-like regulatory domain-containing protein [Nocardioides sp.]